MADCVKDKVKIVLQKSIEGFFEGKEVKVEHVLDYLFPKERRIRSLIGGLETSMGTKVWEPLAIFFAEGNSFTVKDHAKYNKSVPVIPEFCLELISKFKARKIKDPSLDNQVFFQEIKEVIQEKNYVVTERGEPSEQGKGLGIDVWFEKGGVEYLVDIKTNQINAGDGGKFTEHQLIWYCWRALDRADNVRCLLAFPFNPHVGKNFWKKEGSKSKPLIPSVEAVVGDEFWDFLSGSVGTTDLIFECFKELGESGFGDRFSHIFEPKKK